MSKITQDAGIDKIPDAKDQVRFISQFFDQLKQLLNGGLTFVDNFASKNVSVTFSAIATDTAVAHGLGRVPTGYLVIRKSASMVVYDGAAVWTASSIYLKSSATGTITVMVF